MTSWVGAGRFERPTTCTPYRCATRLRYAPVRRNCNTAAMVEQTALGSFVFSGSPIRAGIQYNESTLSERGSRDTTKDDIIELPIEAPRAELDRSVPRPPLVVIVGPTAVGKSALALELAAEIRRTFGVAGEIVSADSRQVYRTLDIGTAKPSLAEQSRVRHHLIDLVDPESDFNVAEFQDRAQVAIAEIHERRSIPILVGGTGLYVRAVADGLDLPRVPPDPVLRAKLEAEAEASGPDVLFRRLAECDPVAAGRIDRRNVRRVVRALEVIEKTGRPFSEGSVPRPEYDVLRVGLTMDRDRLYRVIDDRVDQQMAAGLAEETRKALERGCLPSRPALSGFGYRQMVQYLEGQIDLETATQQYKFATHRFVRQQHAWFRLTDSSIQWFASNLDAPPAVIDAVNRFIENRQPGSVDGNS